jgi:hypothetical protein
MKTDASVDKEKRKEQFEQELKAEMQNNLLGILGEGFQVVLSPVSDRASPSPITLKSSCAFADSIGLINGTAELTEVY